jgi:hypothetical protein
MGALSFDERGVVTYLETFENYGLSTDPVFDRFEVTLDGLPNAFGRLWNLWDLPFVPTRFVEGQTTASGKPDPLPRWQGVEVKGDTDFALPGDVTGDDRVNTADLGVLLGSFGASEPDDGTDINGDGRVDTADLGIVLAQQGATPGPMCIYRVEARRAFNPDGMVVDAQAFDAAPGPGDLLAVPADDCSACGEFSIAPEGFTELVYGEWTLIEEGALQAPAGVTIVQQVAASCDDGAGEVVMGNLRGEISVTTTGCCIYGAFDNLGYDFDGINTLPMQVDCDVFLTSLDTFGWFQGVNLDVLETFNVLFGGVALSLDPGFARFADPDGFLGYFTFRKPVEDPFIPFRFYATAPDPAVGALGKRVLVGEWFSLRLLMRGFSKLEVWVRDSETAALPNPLVGDDADGVSDDGFARILPNGPYGPAIEAIGPGVAPDPFEMETSSLRQLHWLWGGDPAMAPAGGPFRASNWFLDNLRVTSR